MSGWWNRGGLSVILAWLAGSGFAWGQSPGLPAARTILKPKIAPPHIEFSEVSFHFGKIRPGETVSHDFVVTNGGGAPLEISAVQPGCACITVGEWDRRIAPGQTGRIPIRLTVLTLGGPVSKQLTVLCNDPGQRSAELRVQATPWRPLEIRPPFVDFHPVEDEPWQETKIVRILSNLEEPVMVKPPHPGVDPQITTDWKVVLPGKEFELAVVFSGRGGKAMQQRKIDLVLSTSAPGLPSLRIPVIIHPQPPLVAQPQQVKLPPGPFTQDSPQRLTIRNGSERPVQLSDPVVNAQGVAVTLDVIEPGKVFQVDLMFPAGFKMKPGERWELSLKTTHPKVPVLTLPIVQGVTNGAEGVFAVPVEDGGRFKPLKPRRF